MDMSNFLSTIDNIQKDIDAFRPFPKTSIAAWQERLRIEWTYNSNAIEGNTLTFGETAFFLREGLTSEGRPLQDYVEAKNHAQAIDWLQEFVQSGRKFTESFIKELHALLLRDIESTIAMGSHGKLVHKPLFAGKYKTRPNHVLTLSGNIHYYTDPLHVHDEMQELLSWLKKSIHLHPVEQAALFHYQFVSIHPFDDGNGRMARLLMNLILMREGHPPCVIRNERRKEYLQSLEEADTTGDYKKIIAFIAHELLWTQKLMLKAIQGKKLPTVTHILNREDREQTIINTIGENTLSIGQISENIPSIKRPTLKSDLSRLCTKKKLRKIGKGKGVVYALHN